MLHVWTLAPEVLYGLANAVVTGTIMGNVHTLPIAQSLGAMWSLARWCLDDGQNSNDMAQWDSVGEALAYIWQY